MTSTTIRNRRFRFRRNFFSVEYRDESRNVETEYSINGNSKNIEKNRKNGIVENRKIEKQNEKMVRKIVRDYNCNENSVKIDRMKIGLDIIEKIVLIGSGLMALLPSLKLKIVKQVVV